jgi:HSP20 family protein
MKNVVPWKGKQRETSLASRDTGWPLAQFRSEMERLFDRFFSGALDWAGDLGAPLGFRTPALDVAETENEVIVRAELPGCEAKDLDVSVTEDMLTISGEKKSSTEQKGENYSHVERRFGSFQRTLRLPAGVDRDSVAAEFNQGVLTIRMKKAESAKARKIRVSGGP